MTLCRPYARESIGCRQVVAPKSGRDSIESKFSKVRQNFQHCAASSLLSMRVEDPSGNVVLVASANANLRLVADIEKSILR